MATVVLDPGHGGTAPTGNSSPNNATGPTGLLEKTVTLAVGLAAERVLLNAGIRVLMTRRTDQNIGIVARAAVAKNARADAFVSIHFNAAPAEGPPAQGTETWIGDGHTTISRQLADTVQRSVRQATGYRDRGVKVHNVSGVIRPANHDPRTANCLVEISFLDRQPAEEARLRQQSYIDALGRAVADAVLQYLAARGLAAADPRAAMATAGAEPDDAASAAQFGLLRGEDTIVATPPVIGGDGENWEAPPEAAGAGPGDGPVGEAPGEDVFLTGQETTGAEFEAPSEPASSRGVRRPRSARRNVRAAAAAAVQGSDLDPDFNARIGASLRAIHHELESMIFGRSANVAAARAAGAAPPASPDMIVGVGIGPALRDFESVGPDGPGAPVLNLYVAETMNIDQAKGVVVDSFGIRTLSSDQRPVNIIKTGPIDAYGHRHRERPSPCGISTGHIDVTAGTQGVLARGRSGARANRLLMLSNNHVLANVNAGLARDPIIQPGDLDGGTLADRIAILEQWVPIDFTPGANNLVDCATGWCWPDRVRREFIYRRGNAWDYFKVDAQPVTPTIGMSVGKSGRTTQLTSGQIVDVSASIVVNYDQGRLGNFRDQITVRGNNNVLFSAGGDSGSLIWTWETVRRPVGLLFAGGGQHTFANKIHRVLDALDIDLVT